MTVHWLWRGKWFWGFTRLRSRPERWALDVGPVRILGPAAVEGHDGVA